MGDVTWVKTKNNPSNLHLKRGMGNRLHARYAWTIIHIDSYMHTDH